MLKDSFIALNLNPPMIFSVRWVGRRDAPPPAKRARCANALKVLS
jgi:hypothetical protein